MSFPFSCGSFDGHHLGLLKLFNCSSPSQASVARQLILSFFMILQFTFAKFPILVKAYPYCNTLILNVSLCYNFAKFNVHCIFHWWR